VAAFYGEWVGAGIVLGIVLLVLAAVFDRGDEI